MEVLRLSAIVVDVTWTALPRCPGRVLMWGPTAIVFTVIAPSSPTGGEGTRFARYCGIRASATERRDLVPTPRGRRTSAGRENTR